MMSFFRHTTECVKLKTEIDKSTSVHAIGLGYSFLSCSPAELNYASPNKTNLKNK
jgi:hypothetical protein